MAKKKTKVIERRPRMAAEYLLKGTCANQIIIYHTEVGQPLKVSFLSKEWWVTTPGEPLLKLNEYDALGKDDYICLCEADGKVGAWELARMLAASLEYTGDSIEDTLTRTMAEVERLGVETDIADEVLEVELRVIKNPENSQRCGNYSAICNGVGLHVGTLFDFQDFESKSDAEKYAFEFFKVLDKIGFTIFIH